MVALLWDRGDGEEVEDLTHPPCMPGMPGSQAATTQHVHPESPHTTRAETTSMTQSLAQLTLSSVCTSETTYVIFSDLGGQAGHTSRTIADLL